MHVSRVCFALPLVLLAVSSWEQGSEGMHLGLAAVSVDNVADPDQAFAEGLDARSTRRVLQDASSVGISMLCLRVLVQRASQCHG